MRIYLLGFMGVGKTALGRKLAERLGLVFLDLDECLEQREGQSIAEIFEKKGEQHFRKLEADYLRKTLEFDRALIATGGGTPCFQENLEWMNSHGLTIYLKAPVELLEERLEGETHFRPVLKDKASNELKTFIRQSLQQRAPFYEAAHIWYEIQPGSANAIEELEDFLKRFL